MNVDEIVAWLIARAVYGFVGFCIFMGALYQFLNSDAQGLSIANRVFSMLMSVLVVGIMAAYGIDELKWNVYAICFLSILGGMGMDKVLRMILAEFNNSSSVVNFLGRIAKAAKAFWAAFTAINNSNNNEQH